MIKSIIVDDEPYCCETLELMIGKFCPDLEISAICTSGSEALKAVAQHHPALVFLDIEMPFMNGFQFLENLSGINFELIFTTSYDQYAIKAIRFSALDYLLKPIDREELIQAVAKVSGRLQSPSQGQLELLLQKYHSPKDSLKKIALPTMEGLQMVDVAAIISCASESNYTNFFLKNNKKITVSRTMKDMEELLADYSFLRVHNSFMVNLNEVEKYVKGEGGYLIMSDGSNIDVSRTRKETLLGKLQPGRF
ncbi:MAG TPA: LytTR family DNA-binding domain-containing protein [Puia sp.]